MFRMLIHPSSGVCDYLVRYCVGCILLPTLGYHITNSQSRYITPTLLKSAQYSLHNNATSSGKLLKMDVLTSETFWAVNWHNKASVIKLVYLYSNIKMMHGPIRIRHIYFVIKPINIGFITKYMCWTGFSFYLQEVFLLFWSSMFALGLTHLRNLWVQLILSLE